jgi:hypothetical protein
MRPFERRLANSYPYVKLAAWSEFAMKLPNRKHVCRDSMASGMRYNCPPLSSHSHELLHGTAG